MSHCITEQIISLCGEDMGTSGRSTGQPKELHRKGKHLAH